MPNTIKRITKYFKTTKRYDKRRIQRERTKVEKIRHDAYNKKKRKQGNAAPKQRPAAEYITVPLRTDLF